MARRLTDTYWVEAEVTITIDHGYGVIERDKKAVLKMIITVPTETNDLLIFFLDEARKSTKKNKRINVLWRCNNYKCQSIMKKKLQSNFTTPEQSKRLLELGVPADSADCFWFDERDLMFLKDILYSDEAKDGEWVRATDYTPCWSVGRLIELYMKAKGLDFMYFRIMSDSDMIDSIVRMFVEYQNEMDFSKLEE